MRPFNYKSAAWKGFLGVLFVYAVLGAFAKIMLFFDHNEHMYVTASVLWAEGSRLYGDFSYLQMPYQPILYGLFLKIFGGSYYLLTCKILSFELWLLSFLLLYLIAVRSTSNKLFSVGLVLLFMLNNLVLRGALEASNYIGPVFLSMLGYFLVMPAPVETRNKWLRWLLAGLCIAISTGFKLYYAVIILPFLVISLWYPRDDSLKSRARLRCAPMLLGFVIGILPILYYLIGNFETFMFDNYSYHFLNTIQYQHEGYIHRMDLPSKLGYLTVAFGAPASYFLFVMLLFLAILVYRENRTDIKPLFSVHPQFVLGILLAAVTLWTALTPSPTWPQYFTMVAPFLFLLLIAMFQMIPDKLKPKVALLIVPFIAGSILSTAPDYLNALRDSTDVESWSGVRVHSSANEIKKILSEASLEGKVATLAPLQALEAGLPIYPEFSTGHFLYRVGEQLTVKQLRRHHSTSMGDVGRLLESDPPAAILLRSQFVFIPPGYEIPMLKFAREHQYQKIDNPKVKGILYIR